MAKWTLLQYRSVFSEFYLTCGPDIQVAIDQRLTRLLELGNLAREPISKHLDEGIFELRASNARMLYYFDPGRLIIVVVCFLKDQPKVERSYIVQAKHLRSRLRAGHEQAQRHKLH